MVLGEIVPSTVGQEELAHLLPPHHAGDVERSDELGGSAVDQSTVGEKQLHQFNFGRSFLSFREGDRIVKGRVIIKIQPVDQSPVSAEQLSDCLGVALTQQIEDRISWHLQTTETLLTDYNYIELSEIF